jgi:hypothetical protein
MRNSRPLKTVRRDGRAAFMAISVRLGADVGAETGG